MSKQQSDKNNNDDTIPFKVPRLSFADSTVNSWEPQLTSAPPHLTPYHPLASNLNKGCNEFPKKGCEVPNMKEQGVLKSTPTLNPAASPRVPADSTLDPQLLESLLRFYQQKEGVGSQGPQFVQLKSPFECESEEEGGGNSQQQGWDQGESARFISNKHDSDVNHLLKMHNANVLENFGGNIFPVRFSSRFSNFSSKQEEVERSIGVAQNTSETKFDSLVLQRHKIVSDTPRQERAGDGEKDDDDDDEGDQEVCLIKRTQFVKAKNREAQRRFRAKQKKRISELQWLVTVLQSESGSLLSENKRLQCQNSSLAHEVEQLKMENEQLRGLLVRDFIQEMVKNKTS